MYKNSEVENYTNYVILGSGLCSLWSSICFSSAGDIERERFMGTLENLFCSPTKFTYIIFGKVLANTFLGLTGLLLSITFTKIFFNGSLYVDNIPLFIGCFILLIISFISVAFLIAPIFTLSKNARALMNCLEYPVFILCGFIFPVELLPGFVKPISYMLSPTLAIEILRESSLGIENMALFYKKIFMLLGICLVYGVISKLLFAKIDKETRITGSLGVS